MDTGSIKEGNKYTVLKNEDIQKYFSEREKLILEAVIYSLNKKRAEDGKTEDNNYIVVNLDEPYADEVATIIRKYEEPEEGDDENFLGDEDVTVVEFKGVKYTFTKLKDSDVSKEFDKPEGSVILTHRIDGFEIPLYLLVDNAASEFTFAHETGEGVFITLQDEELHDLAVDLVVFANENYLSEAKPVEVVKTEIKPAEQSEENPLKLEIPEYLPYLLRKGQLLLHKKGKPYQIKETDVYHSEKPDEVLIKYKALYETDKKIWVRPAWMFSKDRFAPLTIWEYLQFRLGNQQTRQRLLSKKFGQQIGE